MVRTTWPEDPRFGSRLAARSRLICAFHSLTFATSFGLRCSVFTVSTVNQHTCQTVTTILAREAINQAQRQSLDSFGYWPNESGSGRIASALPPVQKRCCFGDFVGDLVFLYFYTAAWQSTDFQHGGASRACRGHFYLSHSKRSDRCGHLHEREVPLRLYTETDLTSPASWNCRETGGGFSVFAHA